MGIIEKFIPGVHVSAHEADPEAVNPKRSRTEGNDSMESISLIKKKLDAVIVGNDTVKHAILIQLARERHGLQFNSIFMSGSSKTGKKLIIDTYVESVYGELLMIDLSLDFNSTRLENILEVCFLIVILDF